MPRSGFAGLSSISNPPTRAEVRQARKFLFNNTKYGAVLLGHIAIGIFKLAWLVGPDEVKSFIKELETTIIKTGKCEYYASTCLMQNSQFALLYRFSKIWLAKKPFPRGPGVEY